MADHARGCQGREYVCDCGHDNDVDDLIRTASAFVEELRRMGYGETSERALPGSFDTFVEALERLN